MKTCKRPGCDRPAAAAKGMCWMHYARTRRDGSPGGAQSVQDQPLPPCSVKGCDRQARRRSGDRLCRGHYDRVRHNGEPGPAKFRTYNN